MRVYVYYRNPEGQTERVLCFGKDEKELQKDVDKTLGRLGWDKTYCWSDEVDDKTRERS